MRKRTTAILLVFLSLSTGWISAIGLTYVSSQDELKKEGFKVVHSKRGAGIHRFEVTFPKMFHFPKHAKEEYAKKPFSRVSFHKVPAGKTNFTTDGFIEGSCLPLLTYVDVESGNRGCSFSVLSGDTETTFLCVVFTYEKEDEEEGTPIPLFVVVPVSTLLESESEKANKSE